MEIKHNDNNHKKLNIMNLSDLFTRIKHKLFYFPQKDRALLLQVFRCDAEACAMPRAISLAIGMRNSNIKYIRRDPQTNRLILKTSDGVYLATDEYSGIVCEVFCYNLYEPDPNTFNFAEYNVSLNPELSNKIEIHNFGLAAQNGNMDFFIANRDGVNSTAPQLLSVLSKRERKKLKKTKVVVQKASNEVQRVLNSVNKDIKVILKIDVEGAEYEIFDNLCKENIINKVDLIIGDSHYGLAPIVEQLLPFGFELINLTLPDKKSMCQGFIFEKKGSWK